MNDVMLFILVFLELGGFICAMIFGVLLFILLLAILTRGAELTSDEKSKSFFITILITVISAGISCGAGKVLEKNHLSIKSNPNQINQINQINQKH